MVVTHTALIRLSWPAKPLWVNRSSGKHWAAAGRDAAKKAQRDEAVIMAKGQIGTLRQIGDGYTLTITFHKADRRRYDLDNAYGAVKAAQDAIFKEWGRDDSTFDRVTLIRGEPVKGGCVMFEVTG